VGQACQAGCLTWASSCAHTCVCKRVLGGGVVVGGFQGLGQGRGRGRTGKGVGEGGGGHIMLSCAHNTKGAHTSEVVGSLTRCSLGSPVLDHT
jgi:hypothetical protein